MPLDNPMPHRFSMPWSENGELEVVTFNMGSETFALEAVLVREILDLMPQTAVPGADPLVSHIFNFRGRVIPLANLHQAFGMEAAEATPDSRIVVIELPICGEARLIGLRTDKVNEVAMLNADACENPPAIGMRWPRDQVRCLVRRSTDTVIVPDLQTLFKSLVDQAGLSIH